MDVACMISEMPNASPPVCEVAVRQLRPESAESNVRAVTLAANIIV